MASRDGGASWAILTREPRRRSKGTGSTFPGPAYRIHWDMARHAKESQGYEGEAYEYSCGLVETLTKPVSSRTVAQGSSRATNTSSPYLFKLGVPLDEADRPSVPPVFLKFQKNSAARTTPVRRLYSVGLMRRRRTISSATSLGSTHAFQPTFVRYSIAKKDLPIFSAYPSLGADTTLPQHRSDWTDGPNLLPAQT
ncbi:hypothetical protein DL765_000601 [Monosporascus sp. GIB2]|nr:hypothetical protein DL765_000601 [Monosporascus sp. GIB2]